MNTSPHFPHYFKRDLTEGAAEGVSEGVPCYLGSATAFYDNGHSGEAVILITRTSEGLRRFLESRNLPVVGGHIYPVVLLRQNDVQVVDDL